MCHQFMPCGKRPSKWGTQWNLNSCFQYKYKNYIYKYIYVCVCVDIYIYIYIYGCMCVCVCVSVCVWVRFSQPVLSVWSIQITAYFYNIVRFTTIWHFNIWLQWVHWHFLQAFNIVVDSWKFTMLLLYILWDDWLIFMISVSKEQLQQQLEYTLLKPDCHTRWFSKMQSGHEDTLEELYTIKFFLKLGKMPQKRMEGFRLLFDHLAWTSISFWAT